MSWPGFLVVQLLLVVSAGVVVVIFVVLGGDAGFALGTAVSVFIANTGWLTVERVVMRRTLRARAEVRY